MELMKLIPGVEVIEIDEGCCGLAGTWGLRSENAPLSSTIGGHLFRAIEESGADLAVTECSSCAMQIEAHTSLKAMHPISLLARSYVST